MTTTVTLSNLKVELTVEQLIEAVNQLNQSERSQLARALSQTTLDDDLAHLIESLYAQPPIESISEEDIVAEVAAVRRAASRD